VIEKGTTIRVSNYGYRNNSRQPVDNHTVFNAASLSKPVFAYAVLQLVDTGRMALDTPLSTYLPGYIPGDPQAAEITARQVLSHTSGLPGGTSARTPLKTYFTPGEHFSYSAEGFLYLQKVVEKITGENLDATMKRLVFDPLKMNESSYVWQGRFDWDFAKPYDAALRQGIEPRYPAPKSAWTLETTAADYARFLKTILSGERLKPDTAVEWLKPQVTLKKKCVVCIGNDTTDFDTHLAWSLGWGLEPNEGAFFQWGDNDNFKSFAMGRVRDGSAIVVLTNSETGQTIMPDILAGAGFDAAPAFAWLGYAHYDGAAQRFIRAVLKDGAGTTTENPAMLDRETRRAIAENLRQRGRTEDAFRLRLQNSTDHPDCAGCYFDLGISYLDRRQPSDALAAFKHSLKLNPEQSLAMSLVNLLEANAFPTPSPDGKVVFRLDGYTDAKNVSVVGTFDGWEDTFLPMQRGGDGWSVKTNLPPGSYIYAYSIDGSLVPDITNARFVTEKREQPLKLIIGNAGAPVGEK